VLLVTAYALAFFWAPNDADQGFIQKIFYLHVPLAIVALCGFVAGGIYGLRYLRSGDRSHDLRSYVSIHMALIFGVGALITGSIWARASWGHWWLWDEPTLVSFLIVFLLYACYQPLRFSIEDPERQSRYAAVFSIVGGVFVPLNFAAVRSASQDIHPRTLSHADGLPLEVGLTFLIALIGMGTLFVALCKFELVQKTTRMRLKALKRRLAGEDTFALGRSAAPQEV
jgi:heme exporter protein C